MRSAPFRKRLLKILNTTKTNITKITLKDIILIIVGIGLTVTFAQYIIPVFDKTLAHRNELLDIKLYIMPETVQKADSILYYLRLENSDKNISLEDINVYINFQSVIDKEVLHHDLGILGLQRQEGESIKNSNHANIRIEKIFPKGVLIMNYFIRKERFGNPPFFVWELTNNRCTVEYSYNYLGATIRRKINKILPMGEVENKAVEINKLININGILSWPIAREFMGVFINSLLRPFSVMLRPSLQICQKEVLKMTNSLFILPFVTGIVLAWIGFKRWNKNENNNVSWQCLTLAMSLIALSGTLFIADRNLNVVKKQISLQLRPFVTVIGSSVKFEFDQKANRYWIYISYGLKNFGSQPAHEYQKKNDLAIWLKIPDDLLNNMRITCQDADANQTQKDNTILAIGNWRKDIMGKIYKYLLKNPMALPEEINKYFGDKGVKCLGGLYEYTPPPTVVSPTQQTYITTSNRDVGPNYGQGIASGNETLFCYVYLSYESSITGAKYSTFYTCNSDERFYKEDATQYIGKSIPLIEYRQWMDRDIL